MSRIFWKFLIFIVIIFRSKDFKIKVKEWKFLKEKVLLMKFYKNKDFKIKI